MRRYFFDFHGGNNEMRDEEGCEFADLDLAYLDAYRSMVRIGAEDLIEQRDPSANRIDIRDENETVLITLAFDEVFRPRKGERPARSGWESVLQLQLQRSRSLRDELGLVCATARLSIANARMTIERARTNPSVRLESANS